MVEVITSCGRQSCVRRSSKGAVAVTKKRDKRSIEGLTVRADQILLAVAVRIERSAVGADICRKCDRWNCDVRGSGLSDKDVKSPE